MTMAVGTLNLIGQQMQALTAGVSTPLAFPPGTQVNTKIRPHHALIVVEGGQVRWGFSPTASMGVYQAVGSRIDFTDSTNDYAGLLQQVQFIAIGGPATLQIQYMD